jgi:hypothetical protein
MLSRRELMEKGAVGAAATALVWVPPPPGRLRLSALVVRRRATPRSPRTTATARTRRRSPAPAEVAAIAAPPPWELVSPLAAGALLAHGWRLAELGPVRDGSCVVTLQNARGRARRVISAATPGPHRVSSTRAGWISS